MLGKSQGQNKIVSGALLLTLSTLIVKVLGLLYKVPLSYMLSEEGMAYFNSAYTVYTFFYIISTAGVPKAVSILTAEAESEGDTNKVKEIYYTAIIVFFIIGVTLSVLLGGLANTVSKIIGNSGASLTMVAIAPSIAFVTLSGVIRGYFSGRLNFAPIAISEVISGVAKLVLGLVFALLAHSLKFDLTQVSAFTILGTTIGSFFGYIYLTISKNHMKQDENIRQKVIKIKYSTPVLKRILQIAIPLTLTSAIGAVSSVIDLSLIMNRLHTGGLSELQSGILYGNYTTLVIPLLNLSATLIAPISAVLLPLVSKKETKEDPELVQSKLTTATRVALFVAIPISFVFFFLGRECLSLIFEDGSATMATPLLMLIAPGIPFMCIETLINTTLEALGYPRVPLYTLIFATTVKLVLTYFIVGNSEFGILGAPLATSVTYFIGFLLSCIFAYFVVKIRFSVIKSFVTPIIFSVLSVSAVTLLTLGNHQINTLHSILRLVIFAVFYTLCSVIYYIFVFERAKNSSTCTKKR